jgi:hypothetical protein
MFLYFINTMLFANFQTYDTLHVPFLLPSCPSTLYFSTYPHNFVQKPNMYTLSPHPFHIPTTNYPAPFITYKYIHTSLIPICLPLPTLYLPKPFPNIHYQPPSMLSTYYPLNTNLTYPLHTPFSPMIIHSQDSLFTILLTSTIPPSTPFQFPSTKTSFFHYLNITSSPYNAPSYHTHTQHSFLITKFPTLPFLTHPYHQLTPSHYPYISSNHQYIYPSCPFIRIIIYQLVYIPSILIYYKLFLTSPYTLHRTLTPKYLILYPATNYPLHLYYAICSNNHTPYHTLPLMLYLLPNYLTLSLLCVLYHTLHHFHAPSPQQYFPIPSLIKPHYIVSTLLFLLLGGDIETNPGPIIHLLRNHPNDHKQRSRTYFTTNTIQLKPEYQHLSLSFAPYLTTTHPNHQAAQQTHPFLHRFIMQHNQYSPPLLLYTLIVTISPLPTRCNLLLFQPSPLLFTLLQRLSLLTQNPHYTLTTQHPYTQFLIDNQELISLPTSVHTNLYTYISQNSPSASFESTKILFPYLPDTLIREALCYTQPLIGYIYHHHQPSCPMNK